MRKNPPKVLGIVPARGDSKGNLRKNLRLLLGRPLISYTLDAALASEAMHRLVVSTDDPEIAAVAEDHGVEVPFIRPPELARDETPQIDVVLHALEALEKSETFRYDVVVLLQPTAPLRNAEDIRSSVRMLLETGGDSVVSFCRVEQGHPFYMYTIDGNRPRPLLDVPPQVTRRQQFPEIYLRNGAIYATRRDVLVEHRNFYGRDIRAYVMPFERSINIDRETDLLFAERLLQTRREKEEEHLS
jgi:CMP-N,N'-diacetyllegionaminic acid synthase